MGKITDTPELWFERERPNSIQTIFLPQKIKNLFKNGITTNYLFSGKAGTGKTTLAKILCKGHTSKHMNMSDKTGIDILRNEIARFAGSASFENRSFKVVVLDEFDRMSRQAQAALKGMIEEFADTCRFILITNYPEKILELPLFSRVEHINFNFYGSEKTECMKQAVTKIFDLIKSEGFTFEKVKDDDGKVIMPSLMYILNEVFPDMRSVYNGLQSVCSTLENDINRDNVIKLSDVKSIKKVSFEQLYEKLLDIAKSPVKSEVSIYKMLREDYEDKFVEVIDALGTEFLDYINEKGKNQHVGYIAKQYCYYSDLCTKLPDKLPAALALCHEIVKALSKS